MMTRNNICQYICLVKFAICKQVNKYRFYNIRSIFSQIVP